MLNLKFVKLQTKHASIASYLRQTDIDEVTAMTGLSPEVAVAYSIAHTERGFAVELDGRPVVLFGVSGDMIWCVGTDDITQHPITFLAPLNTSMAITSSARVKSVFWRIKRIQKKHPV